MVRTAASKGRDVSRPSTRQAEVLQRNNGRRLRIGWGLSAAAAALWLFGIILGATLDAGNLEGPRFGLIYAVAILQLLLAIAAIQLVAPFRLKSKRRRPMRDWSLRLLALVIILTSLYHFHSAGWLAR